MSIMLHHRTQNQLDTCKRTYDENDKGTGSQSFPWFDHFLPPTHAHFVLRPELATSLLHHVEDGVVDASGPGLQFHNQLVISVVEIAKLTGCGQPTRR